MTESPDPVALRISTDSSVRHLVTNSFIVDTGKPWFDGTKIFQAVYLKLA